MRSGKEPNSPSSSQVVNSGEEANSSQTKREEKKKKYIGQQKLFQQLQRILLVTWTLTGLVDRFIIH